MSPERTQAPGARLDDSQHSAFAEEREAMLRLTAELVSSSSPEAASAVVEKLSARLSQLPGAHNKEEVQALLRRLLDDPGFGRHLDAQGEPLRRALVEANQRLGYPWALEIHPDDVQLALPARLRTDRAAQLAALTMVAAIGSLAWNGLWLSARLSVWEEDPDFFTNLMFGAGALHALMSFGAAILSFRKKGRSLLRWLGRAIAIGPAASIAVLAINPAGFDALGDSLTLVFYGLTGAAPAMVTAALCAWTAAELGKKKP